MDYDLLVIGGGPGGYTAAIRGSQLGMKSAVVERERLGGICLNWGCIPSKALLRTAEVYHLMQKAGDFGLKAENLGFDFAKVIDRSRKVADQLNRGVISLMKKNRIEVHAGTARLGGQGRVRISGEGGEKTVTAKHIVVATGARARPLPGLEFDGKRVLSYKDALVLKDFPSKILIVGAGPIGVEFAYFYNSLGSKVTLVEMMPHLVPLEDAEASVALEKSFRNQGIEFHVGTKVEETKVTKTGVTMRVSKEGKVSNLEGDCVLLAVGVVPNTDGIGLEEVGVATERGFIKVNERLETNVPGIHAIGDVIGPPMLAHAASAEGVTCIEAIADHEHWSPVDYGNIPACTYCQPQVASVGLTEEKARAAGHEVKIGRFPFTANGKSIAINEREGFVKLVFDAKYGELLGAHIVGNEATDMIAELGLARAMEITYLELIKTVHAHPTLTEAVMEAAAEAYGEAINI